MSDRKDNPNLTHYRAAFMWAPHEILGLAVQILQKEKKEDTSKPIKDKDEDFFQYPVALDAITMSTHPYIQGVDICNVRFIDKDENTYSIYINLHDCTYWTEGEAEREFPPKYATLKKQKEEEVEDDEDTAFMCPICHGSACERCNHLGVVNGDEYDTILEEQLEAEEKQEAKDGDQLFCGLYSCQALVEEDQGEEDLICSRCGMGLADPSFSEEHTL